MSFHFSQQDNETSRTVLAIAVICLNTNPRKLMIIWSPLIHLNKQLHTSKDIFLNVITSAVCVFCFSVSYFIIINWFLYGRLACLGLTANIQQTFICNGGNLFTLPDFYIILFE